MNEISPEDRSWLAEALNRFERAWHNGVQPRIEDHLAGTSEPRRSLLFRELIRLERELTSRAGDESEFDENRSRFSGDGQAIETGLQPRRDEVAPGDRSELTVDYQAVGTNNSPVLSPSALADLKRAVGTIPEVPLHDAANPQAAAVPAPAMGQVPEDTGRYQIAGEIGRGGMGVVFKGRDSYLGRDVALKALLERHHGNPSLARRFVDEAQIACQLQHPGIAPVYELGTFGDGRPFFTMKLVKGRTLAELLAERGDPAHDEHRFLAIVEQACQTMAYAHARGVIHRDLKPSNIMVGSFGEVQVMDWGLAKLLAGEAPEGMPSADETTITLNRSDGGADGSRWGDAVGTPAYMAPEQAGGDVEAIDERADVFGLGSILCEVLTGKAAYFGRSRSEVQRKARRAELADARKRLHDSGADAELVSLAQACLEAHRDDRPSDAGEVARRLTAYLAGVQERLKAAELERAAESARVQEAQATAVAAEGRARAERRARQMTVGMGASLMIAGALVAAGWRWVELKRVSRTAAIAARINIEIQDAIDLMGKARATPGADAAAWTEALAAAKEANDLLEPDSDPALERNVTSLLAEISEEKRKAAEAATAALADLSFRDRLIDIRSSCPGDPDGTRREAEYSAAFRHAGIDVTELSSGDAAIKIKSRPPGSVLPIVDALDHWAALRRGIGKNPEDARRLTSIAREADPDPARNLLRDALEEPKGSEQGGALALLIQSAKLAELPEVSLDLLGFALLSSDDLKRAESVLRHGQRRFPGSAALNSHLAACLRMQGKSDEAIRFLSAARAIRIELAYDLAQALESKGESDEAIAVMDHLIKCRPRTGRFWTYYASLLHNRGHRARSNEASERALELLRAAAIK